jgi:endonuclease YncB( thermonuclease family)
LVSKIFLAALACAALALAAGACADFDGRVVAVADGDTLTVLHDHRQIRIRLTEIDAPEKAQAFGNSSRQSLSDLCFGRNATLADKGKDRYGRTLARVHCGEVDANAEQVRRGMAWVYDRYVTDRGLYRLQDEARAGHRGLWTDAAPVPPWEWRRAKHG